MDIRFTTADFGDEASSMAAAKAGRSPEETNYLFGQILIDHPGQAALGWYDDLSFLVPRLCVAAPAALQENGNAQAWLVGAPNRLRLMADGDTVRLTGDEGEDARYPRAELLEALRNCATRFADFLATLAIYHPDFKSTAQGLYENLGLEFPSGS